MVPFAFEWHWDLGHFVFFGLFYGALSVIGATLVGTILKTISDLWAGHIHVPHDDEEEGAAEAEAA